MAAGSPTDLTPYRWGAKKPSRAKERPAIDIDEPTAPGGKVLVMDDHDQLRKLLGKMIASLGYKVGCVSTGEEALQRCRAAVDEGQPFNVVILDLTIPGGIGGVETLKALREMDPGVKAIASSGSDEQVNPTSFSRYGFDGFMSKPYDGDELATVLRDMLATEGQERVSEIGE